MWRKKVMLFVLCSLKLEKLCFKRSKLDVGAAVMKQFFSRITKVYRVNAICFERTRKRRREQTAASQRRARFFLNWSPPPCSHVTQTQRPLCVTQKISRAKANNGLKTAIEAGNFSWRNFINEAPTFRQQQWNVAFVSFFLSSAAAL